MHELTEQQADRFLFDAGSLRSHQSQPAETPGAAPDRAADTFTVRLLAAHDHDQHVAVVGVHGEIDLGTAPVLREALQQVLARQTGPVVVDLSDVAFMDSTGVHVLIDMLERLESLNRRLAIACRELGQVHRVLGLVGVLDALPVYRSRERAVIGGDDRLRVGPALGARRPARRQSTTPRWLRDRR